MPLHQAEPGRNSRRHDAAPDSRPGSFFILAFLSRRQAEPAPISRRHDAAPDSRQAEPAPISRTDLLRVETERSRAGRLPLAALVCANRSVRQSCSSGGMMPHPIRVLVSCGAKLPASRCRVCACCGEGAPPRAPGVYAELGAPEPPDAGAPPCTRVTFLRKESHQRFARNLLVPGPPAKGALPPLIPRPSALAVLVAGT